MVYAGNVDNVAFRLEDGKHALDIDSYFIVSCALQPGRQHLVARVLHMTMQSG